MNTGTKTGKPQVEGLLEAAYETLAVLRERREALLRCGIESSHLPDELVLMAYALLGHHDRGTVVADLRDQWAGLQDKGFAHGAIDKTPTAELRLLAHIREHAEAIGSILEQLRSADTAPQPPDELWRCADEVQGPLWNPVRLHFSVLGGVRHLLIESDAIFHLQPRLLIMNPDESRSGSVVFPIENGALRITLATRSGELFRHVIQARVAAA